MFNDGSHEVDKVRSEVVVEDVPVLVEGNDHFVKGLDKVEEG